MDMMAPSSEPMVAHYRYHYLIRSPDQQQHQVKPTDSFLFEVFGLLRIRSPDSNSYNSSPLFQTSISITCEHFFGDNQDFLRRHITNNPYYFPPDNLDHITQAIIAQVRQLFAFDNWFSEPSDNPEPRVFRLALCLVADEVNEYELERAVMEESMQHDVKMIPASKEAIRSLKTYKLPDQCHICMEKFWGEGGDDDADVEFMPLPCGHGFHSQCILQWLQTSHVCPMCRYPLPTENN